jgi:hypothetical protein
MGRYVYKIDRSLIGFIYVQFLEQRAIREAIARDNQIREMFVDLDTNGDSLYVLLRLLKFLHYLF